MISKIDCATIDEYDFICQLGSGLVFGSLPEHDGCGENFGREEDLREPVVARGDPSRLLQAPDRDLNPIAPFVAALVVFDGLAA